MARIKIGFDVGGVLSKYPHIFRPFVMALEAAAEIEVYIISDVKPHEKVRIFCLENGFCIAENRIHVADYDRYGEGCKAKLCEDLGIHILIDDHMGYLAIAGSPLVRLLVMPDPFLPYYADTWHIHDGEGDFGRRSYFPGKS